MSGFNIFSSNLNDLFNNQSSDEELESSKSEIETYMYQNRSLWRAVILQTIIDILNNSARTENKIAKIEAKQWVFYDNEDFKQVCHLAGYNTQYVRKKIMEIMRQNLISKIIINKIHKEEKFSSVSRENSFDNNFYEKKVQYFNYA